MKNRNHLRNALHNLADNSGASDEYCKGMLVGVVSGLMAMGYSFDASWYCVRQSMPEHHRDPLQVYPEGWIKDLPSFQQFLKKEKKETL